MVTEESRTCMNFRPKTKTLPPLADTSILTVEDFNRIRQNAHQQTDDEYLNQRRILTEQNEAKQAKSRALRERIIEYDKLHGGGFQLSEFDKENLERRNILLNEAQRQRDKNEDCVKEMEKLVLYAKAATIRDRQVEEHKIMNDLYKKKETKLDTMMEVERLKELQFQQEKEANRRAQQRAGALVVIDQIKENERKRLKYKEALEKERIALMKQIHAMEEEAKRKEEQRRIDNEKAQQEIVKANKLAQLSKEKKKLEEKELELKILKYNRDKAKKEEEEMNEKKRIKEERERELQKLREKQERAQDKQAELDALRAKRAFEDNERKTRLKEKQELRLRQKRLQELIEANEKQKKDKESRLAEIAKQEEEIYQRVIKKQMEDIENERRMEEERKKIRLEHDSELRRMIKEKEEESKLERREVLEVGRKIRQDNDDYLKRMERIKQEKIAELKALNVKPKYIADLERYKIK